PTSAEVRSGPLGIERCGYRRIGGGLASVLVAHPSFRLGGRLRCGDQQERSGDDGSRGQLAHDSPSLASPTAPSRASRQCPSASSIVTRLSCENRSSSTTLPDDTSQMGTPSVNHTKRLPVAPARLNDLKVTRSIFGA